MKSRSELLQHAADLAAAFLDTLPDRKVRSAATRADLMSSMGGPLPEKGELGEDVVANLARAADPGIVASAGPRYFGFVIGGALPAALAADWLTSTWDQNGFSFVMSPAASVAEEIAADWILELLGLPSDASVGFTTGVTMASFTGLAAGRHRLLQRVGWDVEDDGLTGAPEIAVVIGAEAHATVFASLQMLGLGRKRVIKVEADEQGRMRADALRTTLAGLRDRPVLVAAQAGNVNTGSFDPLGEIAAAVHELPNAWLHVDGAFGIWAAVAPARRHLVAGL
ncbi:MAG: aminotransferase class V-fold PLP-dependent enzyme, partial [Chloroflexota bacterium]